MRVCSNCNLSTEKFAVSNPLTCHKCYRKLNKASCRKATDAWITKNNEHVKEYKRERNKERYHEDLEFKLKTNLRNRLNRALSGNYKAGSAVKELGCSIEELKVYLASRFKPGMDWNNHGEWHIDHIKDLCLFDLTNPEDFKKACHYTNLQPLWMENDD